MKPRYRLHFHLFDGKTPLWWAQRLDRPYPLCLRTTLGYTNAADAIREASTM